MGDAGTAIVGKVVGAIPIVGNIASLALGLFGGAMFSDPTPQIRAWEAAMQNQLALAQRYRRANPRAYAKSQLRNYLQARRALARRRGF
jgi:hypothetical protein